MSTEQFAFAEILYIIARISQTFESIEGRDGREWMEEFALTLTCSNGVQVGLYDTKTD